MASWKWPAVLNKMLEDIPGINVLLNALLKQDVTGTTDVPAGAKQWVDTPEGKQFQVFNGQSWSSVGKLDHDAASVDGYDASPTVLKNTIPVRDANGDLPGNILGNAKTATKAAALSAVNPIEMGGTGGNTAALARQNLGVPPTDHSSAGTDYGLGNATEHGHNKLSDATDSDLGADGGTAATPLAVKTAKAEAITAAGEALEAYAETQAQKDAAQDTAIAGKLDKSGGTMTGKLEMKNALLFNRNDGGQYIANNYNNEAGSEIYLFARSHATLGGVIILRCFATDGSCKDLKIRPNGDFRWDEASVLTSAGGTMTGTLHGNKNSSLVDFYHLSLSSIAGVGHGGYIDFHFNGSTEGFTSRIIEYDHILNLIASNGVWVNNSPVLTLVSSWRSGTNWYRKYSDGWIEQGGSGNTSNKTITFHTPFTDTNYQLVNVGFAISGAGNQYITSKTTTSFTTASDGKESWTHSWYACGY